MRRLLTAVLTLALAAPSFAAASNPTGQIQLPTQLHVGPGNDVVLDLPDHANETVVLTVTNQMTGEKMTVDVSMPADGVATVPVDIPVGWRYCRFSAPSATPVTGYVDQTPPNEPPPGGEGSGDPANEEPGPSGGEPESDD